MNSDSPGSDVLRFRASTGGTFCLAADLFDVRFAFCSPLSPPTGVSDRFLGFLVPVFIAPVWAKSWSTFLDYARSSGRLLESRLADAVTVLLASVGLSSQPLEGCYASRRVSEDASALTL